MEDSTKDDMEGENALEMRGEGHKCHVQRKQYTTPRPLKATTFSSREGHHHPNIPAWKRNEYAVELNKLGIVINWKGGSGS